MRYYRLYLLDDPAKPTAVRGIPAENEDEAYLKARFLCCDQRWELWLDEKLLRCGKGDAIYPAGWVHRREKKS